MRPESSVDILVVDDLPEKLLVMESILAELGENIITARSGEEALLKVLRCDFAVILLDVNMPSMDGYETAALIRKRKKSAHTPIIFITGYADELHKSQGYSLGAVDYILSPVNPHILRTKVSVFAELFRMSKQAKQLADERVALMQEQAARMAAEAAREVAQAAHRQSSFLAETSAQFSSSLDYDATLRNLARLSVPFVADLCAVTAIGDRGQLGRTELAWAGAADDDVSTATVQTAALPEPLTAVIQSVLESGRVERIEDLGGKALPGGLGWDSASGAGPPFALRTALILPLRARDQVLGILTLVFGPSRRRFGPAQTLLAEDLAGRAAVSLDNARLYRNIQESDTRKNEFLAMLAHELRNPLAAIRGAVEVMGLPDLATEQLGWARGIVDRQVTQLVRLVDDLLDVARITQGKIRLQMEPVELSAIVELAIELSTPLIKARRHELTVAAEPEPLWVNGDATRLSQVLANLLTNAAKYTDEGGKIKLSVCRERDFAVLRVRDNGIGIPGQLADSIFELFTQANRSLDRSQGGLGIGLTLVRHLVEMHGGRVSVHSAGPNQGSEFIVHLPLLSAPSGQDHLAHDAAPTEQRGQRVLVVDDNIDIAESLALLLGRSGNEVRTAHDGPAGLALAESFRPQVVLVDIGLPGMDGYELAHRLRQLPALQGTKLIALTGYGQPEARQRAKQAGFDHHLVKPVDMKTLTEVIIATSASRPPDPAR